MSKIRVMSGNESEEYEGIPTISSKIINNQFGQDKVITEISCNILLTGPPIIQFMKYMNKTIDIKFETDGRYAFTGTVVSHAPCGTEQTTYKLIVLVWNKYEEEDSIEILENPVKTLIKPPEGKSTYWAFDLIDEGKIILDKKTGKYCIYNESLKDWVEINPNTYNLPESAKKKIIQKELKHSPIPFGKVNRELTL